MFGRPRAGWVFRQQQLPVDHAPDGPVTLATACTNLLDTLSELLTHKAVLDGEVSALTEDAVSIAIDAVWVARQTCDKLAANILKLPPQTAAEASLRSEALHAYLTLSDVDELLLSRLIDANPFLIEGRFPSAPLRSSPPRQASNWKTWLINRRRSDPVDPGRNRPPTDHSCQQS